MAPRSSRRIVLAGSLLALGTALSLLVLWLGGRSGPVSPAAVEAPQPAPDWELAPPPRSPEAEPPGNSSERLAGDPLAAPPAEPPGTGDLVTVVVESEGGGAIEGAVVALEGEGEEWQSTGLTAADGRVEIEVPPAAVRVLARAEAPGHFHVQVQRFVAPVLELTLRQAVALRGRVVDAETGSPVAGARVRQVHGSCRGCEPVDVLADGRGSFELDAVPMGESVPLALWHPDYAHRWARTAAPPEGSEVLLELERGSLVRGTVRDWTSGAPVVGATVLQPGHDAAGATTDAAGAFALRVNTESPETPALSVQAEGCCVARFRLDPEELAGRPCDVRLPRTVTVEGVVRDGSGSPVAGARVHGREFPSIEQRSSRLKYERPIDAEEVSTTDEAGRYRLPDEVPWSAAYRIRVSARGYESAASTPIELPGPGRAQRIDAILRWKGAVGTVVGRLSLNGVPSAGGVHWSGGGEEGWIDVPPTGRFESEVPCGALTLTPHPYGRPRSLDLAPIRGEPREVEVPEEHPLEVELDARVPTAPIRGRVSDRRGRGVAGADLLARAPRVGRVLRAVSAADGSYELEVPLGAVFEVLLWHGNRYRSRKDIAAGSSNVDFTVEKTAPVRVLHPGAGAGTVLFFWRSEGQETFERLGGSRSVLGADDFTEASLSLGPVEIAAFDTARRWCPALIRIDVRPEPFDNAVSVETAASFARTFAVETPDPPPASWWIDLIPSQGWPGCEYAEYRLRRELRASDLQAKSHVTVEGLCACRYRTRAGPPGVVAVEPAEIEITREGPPIVLRLRRAGED